MAGERLCHSRAVHLKLSTYGEQRADLSVSASIDAQGVCMQGSGTAAPLWCYDAEASRASAFHTWRPDHLSGRAIRALSLLPMPTPLPKSMCIQALTALNEHHNTGPYWCAHV
jgi:hypothetical protein